MLSPMPVGAERRLLLVLGLRPSWPAAAPRPRRSRRGRDAEQRQDYDRAVVEYTKALRLKPDDAEARLALERAKLRASTDHFQRGRRLAATGKYDQALVEYELAAELNPASSEVDEALRETRNQLRTKIAVAREGKTELQTLIERTRDLPPPGLDLPADAKMPASLVFRGREQPRRVPGDRASSPTSASASIRRSAKRRSRVDLRNASLETRSTRSPTRRARSSASRRRARCWSSPTRRPSAASTKRKSSATFYLSNADLKETMDLLRHGARRAAHLADHGDQRADDQGHARAHRRRRTGARRDRQGAARGRSSTSSCSRSIARAAGVRPADRVARLARHQRSASAIAPDRRRRRRRSPCRRCATSRRPTCCSPTCRRSTTGCSRPTRTRGRWPTRSCARRKGMPAQARFGERVPVPVTTFAPIATGGTPQQPITSLQLREHRRQHRHHAADASRRRCDAGDEGRGAEHLRRRASAGCRRSATAKSARSSGCGTARPTCWPGSSATRSGAWWTAFPA